MKFLPGETSSHSMLPYSSQLPLTLNYTDENSYISIIHFRMLFIYTVSGKKRGHSILGIALTN